MTEAKKPERKPDRGQLRIDEQECKGCGLCIEACPPKVIGMSERLNHYGYRTAVYAGAGCTGCGICFMVCPEPGAITVYRLVSAHEVEAARRQKPRWRERRNAQATDEGQRSHRQERHSCRMPRILWLSHYAGQRDCRGRGGVYAEDRRRVRAGGERSSGHQHAVWRGVGGRARHDRVQRSRHQPDAGRHQLHGRRGAALRHRRHHARRAGPGQHCRRAERLSPGGEGRRPRQLPHHRAGSALRAGDGGPDRAGLRAGRPLSQPGGAAGRWLYRADDGAGRISAGCHRAAPAGVGRGRHRGVARQSDHLAASGMRRAGRT